MEAMLSKEIQAGLDAARVQLLCHETRLRLDVDGRRFAVLRMWKTGFAVAAEDAPNLRGLVDLYDGTTHLFQCLIVTAAQENDEMHYNFKRATPVATAAALDFVRPVQAPVTLIEDRR